MRSVRTTVAAAAMGAAGLVLAMAPPAQACGGLVGPNGAVRLLRTTTLAAYHDGVEHYVTSFRFAGPSGDAPPPASDVVAAGGPADGGTAGGGAAGGPADGRTAGGGNAGEAADQVAGGGAAVGAPAGRAAAVPVPPSRAPVHAEVGSIIPLPGVPTSVERGGDWTLQRLQRETTPVLRQAAAAGEVLAASAPAEVLLEKRIDALDLTVLRGGGAAVTDWAREHGFVLTPDTPAVLDFYSRRSPVFLAARFDAAAARARGQQVGDGTPIHLTIPVPQPWVPLRILALGKGALEPVAADVYLLTDHRPSLLPAPGPGIGLQRSEAASASLLDDLRSDAGMGWVPQQAWLSYLRVDTPAATLVHDLAIDPTGAGQASPVLAAVTRPEQPGVPTPGGTHSAGPWRPSWPAVAEGAGAVAVLLAAAVTALRRRPAEG